MSLKQVFEPAGVSEVPKTSRSRIGQRLAVVHRAAFWPPLTKTHKEKHICSGLRNTWRLIFKVLFTNDCCSTLDGPGGWRSGWLLNGHPVPTRLQHQQGGGGVMIWIRLLGREMVGPFRFPESVKWPLRYVEFLTDYFLPWYKK